MALQFLLTSIGNYRLHINALTLLVGRTSILLRTVRPYVRTSIRPWSDSMQPQTKKWYLLGSMRHSWRYDFQGHLRSGQGHVRLKVSKMTIFKIYLLRHFSTDQKNSNGFLSLSLFFYCFLFYCHDLLSLVCHMGLVAWNKRDWLIDTSGFNLTTQSDNTHMACC